MLELFWSQHAPTRPSWSRQYMSAIFFADETQRAIAEESKAAREKATGRKLHTEIAPRARFWLAEDYHQKYALRHDRLLLGELLAVYDERAFVDSTVAARLNGILSGNADSPRILDEIASYGLSPKAEAHVRSMTRFAR